MEQQSVDDGIHPSVEAPPPPPPVIEEAKTNDAPAAADNSSTIVTAGTPIRRKPNIAAAVLAGLVAVAVFVVILLILNAHGRSANTQNLTSPPNLGAGGPAAASSPPGLTRSAPTASSPANPTERPFPAAPPAAAPGSGAGSDVVIYWRFGERDYFAQHPKTSKKAILDSLIGGDSASIVRVDVENHGASTVTVDSKDFVLSNGTAMISPQANLMPGALTLTHLPPHGSAQGWLLFIKPWIDSGGMTDYLSESALPGAHISVSNRAPKAPTPEAVKSPGSKPAPAPDETVVTTSPAASQPAAAPSPPPGATMPLGGK